MSSYYTYFNSPFGRYRFCRLPLNLCTGCIPEESRRNFGDLQIYSHLQAYSRSRSILYWNNSHYLLVCDYYSKFPLVRITCQ
ncbi:hypothetical protein QZH41_019668, partial [Actinostola sp. cb2023]